MLSVMDSKRFFSPVDKHAQFCYWAPTSSVVNPVPQRCLRPGATCGRPIFLSAMASGQKYLKKASKPLGPFEGHWHPATVMLPQEEEGAAGLHFVQPTALLSPSEQPIHEAAGAGRSVAAISCLGPHFPEWPFLRKKRKGKKRGGTYLKEIRKSPQMLPKPEEGPGLPWSYTNILVVTTGAAVSTRRDCLGIHQKHQCNPWARHCQRIQPSPSAFWAENVSRGERAPPPSFACSSSVRGAPRRPSQQPGSHHHPQKAQRHLSSRNIRKAKSSQNKFAGSTRLHKQGGIHQRVVEELQWENAGKRAKACDHGTSRRYARWWQLARMSPIPKMASEGVLGAGDHRGQLPTLLKW